MRLTILALSFLVVMISCQQDAIKAVAKAPVLPDSPYSYAPKWGGMHENMQGQDIGITDNGATLGRVLFYDKILSIDNTVSCGSCHHQANAFADAGKESIGVNNQKTSRNAPAISNLYNDNLLFWDGRATSIKDLVLKPVRNHKEMGMEDMNFLVAKIKAAPYYNTLFTKAFGTGEVTSDRIADAMTQYIKSMVGCNSDMDRSVVSGQPLSPMAEMGRSVFFGKGGCYNCHSGPDFSDRGGFFFDPTFPQGGGGFGWAQNIANTGLDENSTDIGMGVFDNTLVGVFKIPSLRNVAMTAPYMHDGRFSTLEEVVEHYNSGIKNSPNLDRVLRAWDTGDAIKLGLTDQEKSGLVAFLHSLTDEDYMKDQRFSDPFSD